MAKSALEVLAREFSNLILTLEEDLDPAAVTNLLNSLGWDWPDDDIPDMAKVSTSLRDVSQSLTAIDFTKPFDEQKSKYHALFTSLNAAALAINDVDSCFPSLPATVPVEEFRANISRRLFDYLICQYLWRHHRTLYGSLLFWGVIREPDLSSDQSSQRLFAIEWSRASRTLGNLPEALKDEFRWGDSTNPFNGELFLRVLEYLMVSCDLPARQRFIDAAMGNLLGIDVSSAVPPRMLRLPLHEVSSSEHGFIEAGFDVVPIPEVPHGPLRGWAIAPYVQGGVTLSFRLSEDLLLEVTGDAKSGIAIRVLPSTVDVKTAATTFSGQFGITLRHESKDAKIVILGSPAASRFEYQRLQFGLVLTSTSGVPNDLVLELGLTDASIVIQGGDGVGFISKILPREPVRLDLTFLLRASRSKGIVFEGGARLEWTLQINKELGPIYIKCVDLIIEAGNDGIVLYSTMSGSATLGPVSAVVERIGLETALDFTKKGLLGDSDLTFGFKPPSGVGLSVSQPPVKGGGFLSIENGNYAGILAIDIEGTVSITAIGILITKMPDGSKTFALTVLGFATFQPVQIGFGFSLSGVGIAAAIECGMNVEALRASVYDGTLTSILFPPDPVANAVQIISDIKSFFPPDPGHHVFGIMAQIGWGGGTPLVRGDLGVFLAIGGPVRIALAGIIRADLPTEDDAVVLLRLQILGVIDLGEKTLAIDSSLFGSRILDYPLDGEIALRTGWGDNPRFAFSAGGFFPGYPIPAGFPSLARISVSLGSGNPRIGLFLYHALTENSVHIGAAVVAHWHKDFGWPVGLIELDGGLAFDALIVFNPFSFEARFAASVSVKRNGDSFMSIDLRLTLTGPNNYHAVGYAKAEICSVDVKVEFDKRFGDKKSELPQEIRSPKEALLVELAKHANWTVILPPWGSTRVAFRSDEDGEPTLDPLGAIEFRQRSVPLDLQLEKFGQAAIPPNETTLGITVNEGVSQPVVDSFAPGEFLYLSDHEKVSGPPFEKFNSGISVTASDGATPSELVLQDLSYETVIVGERIGAKVPFAPFLGDKMKIAGRRLYSPGRISLAADKILVQEQLFAVVGADATAGKFTRSVASLGNNTFAASRIDVRKATAGTVEVMDAVRAVPEPA